MTQQTRKAYDPNDPITKRFNDAATKLSVVCAEFERARLKYGPQIKNRSEAHKFIYYGALERKKEAHKEYHQARLLYFSWLTRQNAIDYASKVQDEVTEIEALDYAAEQTPFSGDAQHLEQISLGVRYKNDPKAQELRNQLMRTGVPKFEKQSFSSIVRQAELETKQELEELAKKAATQENQSLEYEPPEFDAPMEDIEDVQSESEEKQSNE
jgi:hypothetical protein